MNNEVTGKYFRVLDDGFVSLVDFMGGDEDIEQAARVSYGKGTRKSSDTKNLIRYLKRHAHSTPSEMVELKFHIRIPMDAWRQMIRTRTASVNEYSTRYSEAIDSCQKTNAGEWRLQSPSNKQGSSGFLEQWPEGYVLNKSDDLDDCLQTPNGYWETPDCCQFPGDLLSHEEQALHRKAKWVYKQRLLLGVAREQARKDLPLSTYTEAYWKIDFHNLCHFLKLRLDSHAQLEIRRYANVMACLAKTVAPLAFEAFLDYSVYAHNFSRLDMQLLKELLSCKSINRTYLGVRAAQIGMSKREIEEFWHKIDRADTVDSFDWRTLTEITPNTEKGE